jgi:RNA polymerase sigma-70 factor (ECF subfamily)
MAAILMGDTTLTDLESSRAGETDVLLGMDEEAFRAFYDRTARPVWAYLSRLTGDPHAADDLLQETYYRFYRASATYESESHRRNSLFRIATNLARDLSRRQRRKPVVALPESHELPIPADTHAETRTDLGRALTQLAPLQRELVWLAYGQGCSHEEIASVTGVKAADVKSLLYRTRRKLGVLLGGGGVKRG